MFIAWVLNIPVQTGFYFIREINMDLLFFINAIALGIGLAMDAFSVSVANGLNEPKMPKSKEALISITFGVFQLVMPLIGWLCVHYLLESFKSFEKYIPWIALILLLYIGGKMILESINNKEEDEKPTVGFIGLMVQGVATSIDALSVGFTIASFNFVEALVESAIIGLVTTIICIVGIYIGKKFGNKFSKSASIIGGIILIAIGIEIFLKGII